MMTTYGLAQRMLGGPHKRDLGDVLFEYEREFIARDPDLSETVVPRRILVDYQPPEKKRARRWVACVNHYKMRVRVDFCRVATEEEVLSVIRHEVIHLYLDFSPSHRASPIMEHARCARHHCRHFRELACRYQTGVFAYTTVTQDLWEAYGKPRWRYYCPRCVDAGITSFRSRRANEKPARLGFVCGRCWNFYFSEPRKRSLQIGDHVVAWETRRRNALSPKDRCKRTAFYLPERKSHKLRARREKVAPPFFRSSPDEK